MKLKKVKLIGILAILNLSMHAHSQSVVGVTKIHYNLSLKDNSESNFIDSIHYTYDNNCLNQIDSIHLKNIQKFDSVKCAFLSNLYLNIVKNDSSVDKVVFKSNNGDDSFVSVVRVNDNEYEKYMQHDGRTTFLEKIIISENSWSVYTPERFNTYFEHEKDSTNIVFDSLNYLCEKYFFENGFITQKEYSGVRNGEEISNYKGVIEISYLFIKNTIHVTKQNKSTNYKELIIINFDNSYGIHSMSKFIFISLITDSLVEAAYESHYPILLSYFPELLEKLR